MALKAPVRVFRKTFPAGTSKSIDFAEAGFTAPLDTTHLLLAFIFVANTTVATFPGTWTSIFGGSTGSGPTQIRLIAMQGDGSTNSLTIGTANAVGSITLVAYPDFAGLTPITAASSVNVTTATATYNLPDFGTGTGNGVLFDMIGGPSTFAGATYNRGTLVGDLDASGQMILAQEYTDGSADQSVTVNMPSSRVGRYSQVVMPIGVGSGATPVTGTATSTLGGLTQSASGSFDTGTPAVTGTMTTTLPTLTQTAVGGDPNDTWAPNWPDTWGGSTYTFTGTAGTVLASLTQSASGNTTAPGVAGSASSGLPGLSQNASGTTTVPVFSGTATSSLTPLTQTASGNVVASGVGGSATSTLPAITQTATGTRTVPVFTGTASSSLPSIGQTATGSSGVPAFTGTAATVLYALSQSATGAVGVPGAAGSASSVLGPLSQSGTGTHTVPVFTGAAATTLAGLSQSSTGAVGVAAFTGTALSVLPLMTQNAAGSFAGLPTRLPRFIDLEQRSTLTLTLRD